ncbi:B12-binding domain-containing protein [Shewanella sp. 4_MG-2023]|uniref:cobalamin B12-binding domain-containing protein n=1 Tax=Shewanella sp. 4_MG-2023 TaxID=3062652 RepID=UPI0026E11CB7|nr:cobalamin B12-binding domain-containing protein [Shewanella sp. 4_MG-2023]MDO6677072.1 cobalamin B12-binding domain-containing protein [Shewanella sp. 4_MG-2023]
MDSQKLNTLLATVTDNAINAYCQFGEEMLVEINRWISKPEQSRFLNGNSLDLLINNHRNHLGFISQVIESRDGTALVKALPWVYQAYHSQGVPFLYFKEELEKWQQLILKTIPPIEAAQLVQIYDWMLRAHDECCSLIKGDREEEFIAMDNPFLHYIITGDHRNAYSYAFNKVATWEDFERFFNNEAQPALYQIGLLWQNGDVSVSTEHLATAITNRVLTGLLMHLDLPEITKPKILVTCAASEQHQIGSWMVATALEANEWDTTYLGADAPKDAILDYITNESPKAVIISVTMPYNIKKAREILQEIDALYPHIKTIVGGQALSFFHEPQEVLKADFITSDYKEAIQKLNTWLA